MHLKPEDVRTASIYIKTCAAHSLVVGLQFSCLSEKECSLKTVLHVCKPEDSQPGRTWRQVLGPPLSLGLSLIWQSQTPSAKCTLHLGLGFTRVD